MKQLQIVARIEPELWQRFKNKQQVSGFPSESAFLISLIESFFGGAMLQTPESRLASALEKLQQLEEVTK